MWSSVNPCLLVDLDEQRHDHHGARLQGLTLVHFSAQLEPCLLQENTLHTGNTP